jgi:hypothetical protein
MDPFACLFGPVQAIHGLDFVDRRCGKSDNQSSEGSPGFRPPDSTTTVAAPRPAGIIDPGAGGYSTFSDDVRAGT